MTTLHTTLISTPPLDEQREITRLTVQLEITRRALNEAMMENARWIGVYADLQDAHYRLQGQHAQLCREVMEAEIIRDLEAGGR